MVQEPWMIDDEDRYSRLRLIAWWDQARLAASRILVVGAGALGNEVLKNLALVGVGSLVVVDSDLIEKSNLTRSVLFRMRDCGRSKAEVAAEAIQEMNPDSRIRPLHADVMTNVGLGFFRDADVVIGCLDNREARLWVNRQCWKVGTPWVDGGIQEINGVVKVFIPPDSACYECGMTENDYRLINLRYSCPLLSREQIQAGKVPTAPTIASIIGGIQVQEALKLIHEIPCEGGVATVFNGLTNRLYTTRYQRREDCLSHETYSAARELDVTCDDSAERLFEAARKEFDAVDPLRLPLERDLVVSIDCHACGTSRPILKPMEAVPQSDAVCPDCGDIAQPVRQHVIEQGSSVAEAPLRQLGIAPYDIVRVQSQDSEAFFLLREESTHGEPRA